MRSLECPTTLPVAFAPWSAWETGTISLPDGQETLSIYRNPSSGRTRCRKY